MIGKTKTIINDAIKLHIKTSNEIINALEAQNDQLSLEMAQLEHDYCQITQMVKCLLGAVDKISPDVEGYFEPINEELCKLRDWIKDTKK